ncbi:MULTISPECIES: AAA family ATPase [unclassified Mesorhizobium]|uniref:AAA family ATPase n=1 Tax=unclassified Mesorhizobium TaxID=325217 RepID=UPI001CCB919C|nr:MULTISPECIES: AAA family ATPase [unclassified Mesorhizobium]MBZ9684647.1 AAA family ATPase [Mesorhizobium sp. CO1-1-2]MBZ9924561.1 AAA family ATPase [Mesorhizobium sp. BR1-1-4]
MTETSSPLRLRLRRRPPPALRPWPAIDNISIDGLFGRYSYPSLDLSNQSPQDRDIALFYGGNGTGKTTLLKLIYAALSPEDDAGLRSLLSATPFRRFTCHLRDNTIIDIQKKNGLIGDYDFRVSGPHEMFLSVIAGPDLAVRLDQNPNVSLITEVLSKVGLDMLFLHDSRRVQTTSGFLQQSRLWPNEYDEEMWYASRTVGDPTLQYKRPDAALPIEYIVATMYEWLRDRAARQGSSGESDVSLALLQLMRTLGTPKGSLEAPRQEDVLSTIAALEKQTTSYMSHGLMTEYPFAEIRELVLNAPRGKFLAISSVLGPFLSSVETRMHALREVHSVISTFETEMNSYLRDKQVFVNVLEGVRFSDGKRDLELDSLSSGERQLVFLFCAAVLSRGTNSLFLVDEPELSLNSKWQRNLVGSMSNLVRGARTQFVMATHSIEILSRHRGSAIGLDARGSTAPTGE